MNKRTAVARQFLRFAVGGGVGFILYYAALYLCTEIFHIWYVASATIGFVVSIFVNFFINKFWTFKNLSRKTSVVNRQLLGYLLMKITSFGANIFLTYLIVEYLHVYYLYVQFFIVGPVHVAYSFFVQRNLVFGKKSKGLTEWPVKVGLSEAIEP